jgi:heme/copper-type cytochrome/quinol oxidase subunit 2
MATSAWSRWLLWWFSALVVPAVVLLSSCAGSGDAVAAAGPPQRIEVDYSAGNVQGGVSRIPVAQGRRVQLMVRSDVADQVHVHGYDRKVDVPAGGSATIEFVADRSGVFEVELESRSIQLAQLEVS